MHSSDSSSCSAAEKAGAQLPHIAVCLVGAARSFPSPLLLSSLRHNYIEALEAPVRLFVQLKMADTAKALGPNRMSFGVHRSELRMLKAALDQPWLKMLLEEVAIVNGSSSFSGIGRMPVISGVGQVLSRLAKPIWQSDWEHTAVFQPNRSEWRAQRAKRCSLSSYLAAGTNQQRLILNHLSQAWCRRAIQRSEVRRGSTYDLVAYTRPDLMWWQPIVPWCTWWTPLGGEQLSPPASVGGDAAAWAAGGSGRGVRLLACGPRCDLTWLAPRSLMPALLGQLQLHRECSAAAAEHCCATPEALLALAKRVGACLSAGGGRACISSSIGGGGGRGGGGGALVTPRLDELNIFGLDQRPIGSLLRSSVACTLALHPDATRAEGVALATRRGVSRVTADWLRQLFAANVTACERALRTTTMSTTATVAGGANANEAVAEAMADQMAEVRLTFESALAAQDMEAMTQRLGQRLGEPMRQQSAPQPQPQAMEGRRLLELAQTKVSTSPTPPAAITAKTAATSGGSGEGSAASAEGVSFDGVPRRYSDDRYRSARPLVAPRNVLRLPSQPLRLTHERVYVSGPSELGQAASRRRRVHFFNPSIAAAPPGICPRCAYAVALRADVLHQCSSASPVYGEEGLPRSLPTNGFYKGSALALLNDQLQPIAWTWLLNAPEQQVVPAAMASHAAAGGARRGKRRGRRRNVEQATARGTKGGGKGGGGGGDMAQPGGSSDEGGGGGETVADLLAGYFVPRGASGVFPPPWSAHAIDARLLSFGGSQLLATFVRSCHARQPCNFGVSQVHVTGKPTADGGLAHMRAWAHPTITSTSRWAQGRNQALFESAGSPTVPAPTPVTASRELLVAPWPGLVASFGAPSFKRKLVRCAPWAAKGAAPRRVVPWVRKQNRAACGTTPPGTSLELNVMGTPDRSPAAAAGSRAVQQPQPQPEPQPQPQPQPPFGTLRLLYNHSAKLPRGVERQAVGAEASGGVQRVKRRTHARPETRSLTTNLIRVTFDDEGGSALSPCEALLGVGHVHHTDGYRNEQRFGRRARPASEPASEPSSPGADYDAAPFLFGADYDHHFFTLSPVPPYEPLAVSDDFCIGAGVAADAAEDCERVQFVSGITLERARGGAAQSAWMNATIGAEGRVSRDSSGAAAAAAAAAFDWDAQALLLSYGVNDCEARVARIPIKHVRRLLRPLTAANGRAYAAHGATPNHEGTVCRSRR